MTSFVTGRNVHADRPLAGKAVMAFNATDAGFIGNLFPAVPVSKQSDTYYQIDKASFLKRHDSGALRAPGTEARRKLWTVSSDNFFCQNYALAGEIPMEYMRNADDQLRLRENTALSVTHDLRLQQEKRIANLVTSISNVGSGVALTGANKWSDANSDPLAAVNTAQAFIRSQTGLIPRDMILDWSTEKTLRQHPAIIDRFKYTSGGEVNRNQLAEFFDVDRIHVANAVENTGAETTGGDVTMADVWGNTCILAHMGPAMGLMTATPLHRFQWTANDIYPDNFGVLRSVENAAGGKHVEVIEVGHFQAEKVVARDLMYTITGTL